MPSLDVTTTTATETTAAAEVNGGAVRTDLSAVFIDPTVWVTSPPELPTPAHRAVGPVQIFDGTFLEAVTFCRSAMEQGVGARVATANLDFLALAREDTQLRDDLEQSTLVVADGEPVVRLARIGGARRAQRIAGVDLVTALCRAETRDQNDPLRVVLYGSDPITAQQASDAIETSPGASVVLILSPPFRQPTAQEQALDRQAIAAARPHLVLVALGCPKQERRIAEYFDAAPQAVWIGVGGTFDFLAGRRRRAPRVIQRAGLEWCMRLAQEPRRLWRRYLLRDLPALLVLVPSCVAAGWASRHHATDASPRSGT